MVIYDRCSTKEKARELVKELNDAEFNDKKTYKNVRIVRIRSKNPASNTPEGYYVKYDK